MMKLHKHSVLGLVVILLCADPASSCSHRQPLFVAVNSSHSNVHFSNTLVDHDSLNILDYLYYYNGGGVAIGDINNDGLPDIYFTANSRGNNKLYLNKGNFVFEDITGKAGVDGTADWSSGVTMADVNGDGWLDIYVCAVSRKLGLTGHNTLYINNGNGTFTDRSAEYELDFSGYSTQAVFFDYDHDGLLDCFLLNQSSHSVETYGDTSLRKIVNPLSGDKLFRQERKDGKIIFTDVTAHAGIYSSALGYGLGVSVADLNNDGWEDIYVGNDFHENDYYYVNNHDGTFSESGARHFNHYSRYSMGNDIADYNNDGQLDVITVDMLPNEEKYLKSYSGGDQYDIYTYTILANGFQNQFSRNCLQKNLGDGQQFSDQGLMSGVSATDWSWSPLFADFDNDGVKDLFVSNGIVKRPLDLDYIRFISGGSHRAQLQSSNRLDKEALAAMPDGATHNYIFRGRLGERFEDVSDAWGMTIRGYSNGAAYADLNNDGKLDLVINNISSEALIYENKETGENHYLTLRFTAENNNRFGIGVKATVFAGGKMQYQQQMLTRGFQSSSEPRLHFGLGQSSSIDSIVVVWPDGQRQMLKGVKADQEILIDERNSIRQSGNDIISKRTKPVLRDITDSVKINWSHHENVFNDFSQQYFLPHELSTLGPKIAVGDVNGDGFDDIFVCGARYQGGSLFVQQKGSQFVQRDTAVFRKDAQCEDTGAFFFDADGDGDLDLYVVSGGNEIEGRSAALLDRLYLNDGKGNFVRSVNCLPQIFANKAIAIAADIDHDGDQDIFVGAGANASAYGLPQTSWVLLNDGKGHFTIAGDNIINLKNIGMVSSAVFSDLRNSGYPDLLLTGEWMPVVMFENDKGHFKHVDIHAGSGLWQTLEVADINGDGKPDILAGNFGLNAKLHASKADPLRLYVKDFDGNNATDQLLTYSIKGKEYTFLGKDEIEKQLPQIKKTFLKYNEFAGKTVQQVFGNNLDGALKLQATELRSGAFINDGKGSFTFKPFPFEEQASPIFSIMTTDVNNDGVTDVLSGGNLYGVLPYEGRYDASWGDMLLGNKENKLHWTAPPESGFIVRGEIRDIKKIRIDGRDVFVVARNNNSLQFFAR